MDNIKEKSTIKENIFFTPSQMFVGTLLGGVLMLTYMLAKNYSAFDDIKKRNSMILLGIIFLIFFTIYIGPIHPKSSTIGMYAGIGIVMSFKTKKLLTEKGYIKTSKNFLKCDFVKGTKLYSWWHVIFASVIGTIITIAVSFMIEPMI